MYTHMGSITHKNSVVEIGENRCMQTSPGLSIHEERQAETSIETKSNFFHWAFQEIFH